MNPHQKNKVDISSLSSDEQRLFRLYGKLPNKKDLLQNKLKERKYFDSGDYALSKAGKESDSGMTNIGTEHPSAESIPHMSPLTQQLSNPGGSFSQEGGHVGGNASSPPNPMLPGAGLHRGSINGIPGGGLPGATSRSPIKESSFLARTASVDQAQDAEESKNTDDQMGMEGDVSPPAKKEGIPIRR